MITWFSRKKKHTGTHPAKRGSDDFVSLSSHELRSPLSVIKWYTEILLDEDAGKLTDDQRKYLTLIESSNQRAIDLIRALLNVSRLDLGTFSISPEIISVQDMINDSIVKLDQVAKEKGVTIVFDKESECSPLLADKNLVGIIFRSLLSNAVSFSHKEGVVTVFIHKKRAGDVFLGTSILDDSIIVSVTDTGIGVPSEEMDKIATKMFKASNAGDGNGSGLSLYIVKTVLNKVHGRFGFSSEEGKGSTFFAAFPVQGMRKKEGRTTLE